jgi:DNA polymerase III alpha subunit (gram-positive type)
MSLSSNKTKKPHQATITSAMRGRPVASASNNSKPMIIEKEFDEKYKPKEIIVVYDLETTGLLWHDECRITDIAGVVDSKIAKRFIDKKLQPSQTEFVSLINPGIPIPPEVTELNGLADEDVNDAEDTKAVLTKFNDWLISLPKLLNLPSNFPVVLVAHSNFKFDQVVLQLEYLKCGLQLPGNVRFADTYHTIKHTFKREWSNQKLGLQNIYRVVMQDPNFNQSHRAKSDVDMLLKILHNWSDMQDFYQLLVQDAQGPYTQTELNKIVKDIKADHAEYSSKVKDSHSKSNSNNNNYTNNNKRKYEYNNKPNKFIKH